MNAPEALEIWELTIPGRVTLTVTNSMGRPQQISAIGVGSRLRMTTMDRQLAEEGIRVAEHNPFRNGMMVRIDKKDHSPAADEISDEDLQAIFELEPEDFRATVSELGEVNIRRLKAMVEKADASKSEMEYINELIEERYPIGGTVPSYEEMQPKTSVR